MMSTKSYSDTVQKEDAGEVAIQEQVVWNDYEVFFLLRISYFQCSDCFRLRITMGRLWWH